MPPKKKEAKVSKKKQKKDESEEEEDQDSEDEKPKKKTEKVSKSKKIKKGEDKKKKGKKGKGEGSGKMEGMTPEEYEKYQEHIVELSKETQNTLKEMLRKNYLKQTGTKKEQCERIAEAKVLGRTPKCPKCGGGRPNYDIMTGTYRCPGYRDDTEMRWCNKKFAKDEITRETWED